MIIVTGGSGKVGGPLVEQLAATGTRFRLIARHPEKVKASPNIEVVKADLTDETAIMHAMKGGTKLFMLTPSNPESVHLQRNVIEAAIKGGVRHVVRLSVIAADLNSPVTLSKWHAQTDEWLKTQNTRWTLLRPGSFMQNALASAATVKKDGAIYGNQGDGKSYPLDARDIAAVAVKALTTDGHEGQTYTLLGPEALTMAQMAAKLGKAIGKTVQYVNLTNEQFKGGLTSAGLPEWLANDYVTMGSFVASGAMNQGDPTLNKLLGKSRTYDEFASAYAAAFK